MAPFALVNVGLAWPVWNYAVAVLFAGQLYATVKLMRRPLWDWASLTAIGFTVMLEPLHIGLANGQPTVPTISLLVLAMYWASRNCQLAAGAAFAIATALKPQVAAPFVLLLAFQGPVADGVVRGFRRGRPHVGGRGPDAGAAPGVVAHVARPAERRRGGRQHRQRPGRQPRPRRFAQPGADRPPVHAQRDRW